MNLGNKIQELRKKNNLSQENLAEKIGVARQTISKWELNETSPDIKDAQKLAEIFDISLDELINNNTKELLVKVSDTEKLARLNMKIFKIIGIIILLIIIGMIFKHKFNYDKYNNFSYDYSKLQIKDTIEVKTIDETNYITYKNLKIRNDFKNYEINDSNNYILSNPETNEKVIFTIRESLSDTLEIIGTNSQVDNDFFIKYLNNNYINSGVFLLQHSMNEDNDINIFMPTYLMKERAIKRSTLTYYFGLDTNLSYDVYYIVGDLNGIIRKQNDKNIYIIELSKGDKTYTISLNINKDIEYIKELISTIHID